MMGLMRAEWTKLRSLRSTLWTSLTALAIPIIVMGLIAGLKNRKEFVNSSAIQELSNFIFLSVLLCGVISVFIATAEYSSGTIRQTLVASPQRARVLLAKLFTAALFSAAMMALIQIVSCGIYALTLKQRGISQAIMATEDGTRIIAMYSCVVIVALLSMSLGMIFRNSAGAITLLLLWPLLLENLINAISVLVFNEQISKWLPFQSALNTINSSGSITRPLLSFGLVTAVIVGFSSLLFFRRDA